LGLTQLFFAVCLCNYLLAPWIKNGTPYQPLNLAFGACGAYCVFTGRFPFLARIGMAVAGQKLESRTDRLGFLNLFLTAIAFIGALVYMGWVGSQHPLPFGR
jgi:hypothetical protein